VALLYTFAPNGKIPVSISSSINTFNETASATRFLRRQYVTSASMNYSGGGSIVNASLMPKAMISRLR